MNSITSMYTALIGVALLIATLPLPAAAATRKPSCELIVTTPSGVVQTRRDAIVVLSPGEKVEIVWESKHAKTAQDQEKESIDLDGTVIYHPDRSTTYSYRFRNGSRSATCSVEVVVATVTIDRDSLNSERGTPQISGTASGVRTVRVVVQSDGKTIWKSKEIKVKRGTWQAKLKKRPADGAYEVRVYGVKDLKNVVLTQGTLTVGEQAALAAGSIAVSPIPLLFGGSTRAGVSVPVAYVKVVNTGATDVAISGFYLRQNGSAPVTTVIGFTTSDDKGGSRFTLGGAEGTTPFIGNTVFVPLPATVVPGQLRIFTVKALIGARAAAHVGTQLMLDVASVQTHASVTGLLPMRGTTWTLTY